MIKNIYLRCALVLSCICVGSAVIIGGIHAGTDYYIKARGPEVPNDVKNFRPDATFKTVTDFEVYSKQTNSTKVTLNAVYALKDGNNDVGYAYKVNAGRPQKTDVEFYVLFEGKIDAKDINTLKPSAIKFITGGDPGYDSDVKNLANGIIDGSATANSYENVVQAGATRSQKYFIDGIQVAREDYVARINGETSGQPAEKTPIETIYGDLYKSSVEDAFTAIKADTEHCSYEITNRYTVTLTDSTVTKAYAGTTSFHDPEGETDVIKIVAAFSGNKTSVKLDGYKVTKDIGWNDYKDFLNGVSAGTTSLEDENAVHTGSTLSTNAIRDLIIGMRADYIANYKTTIEEMYGTTYVSESLDEYAAVTGSTANCSYELTKRYSVELNDGTTGKAYEATTSFKDPEGETDVIKLIAAWSGDAANAKLVGYKLTKNITWDDYKGYISDVKNGKTSLDDASAVHTGSTLSTNAIRDVLLAMRTDYIASKNA